MSKSKEQILSEALQSHEATFPVFNIQEHETAVLSAMEDYAKEQMTTLLTNISRQPVQVYSEKVRGEEKKFFLGRKFIDDLIARIKNT